MGMTRMRLWLAGVVAFLIGVPLTEKAFGQTGGIVTSGIDLGLAIANASAGES